MKRRIARKVLKPVLSFDRERNYPYETVRQAIQTLDGSSLPITGLNDGELLLQARRSKKIRQQLKVPQGERE